MSWGFPAEIVVRPLVVVERAKPIERAPLRDARRVRRPAGAFVAAPVFNRLAERELAGPSPAAVATRRAHLSRSLFLCVSLGATGLVLLLVFSIDAIPEWSLTAVLGFRRARGVLFLGCCGRTRRYRPKRAPRAAQVTLT